MPLEGSLAGMGLDALVHSSRPQPNRFSVFRQSVNVNVFLKERGARAHQGCNQEHVVGTRGFHGGGMVSTYDVAIRGYSTGVDLTMYGFTLHVGEITGRYFRRDNPCSKVWRLS